METMTVEMADYDLRLSLQYTYYEQNRNLTIKHKYFKTILTCVCVCWPVGRVGTSTIMNTFDGEIYIFFQISVWHIHQNSRLCYFHFLPFA